MIPQALTDRIQPRPLATLDDALPAVEEVSYDLDDLADFLAEPTSSVPANRAAFHVLGDSDDELAEVTTLMVAEGFPAPAYNPRRKDMRTHATFTVYPSYCIGDNTTENMAAEQLRGFLISEFNEGTGPDDDLVDEGLTLQKLFDEYGTTNRCGVYFDVTRYGCNSSSLVVARMTPMQEIGALVDEALDGLVATRFAPYLGGDFKFSRLRAGAAGPREAVVLAVVANPVVELDGDGDRIEPSPSASAGAALARREGRRFEVDRVAVLELLVEEYFALALEVDRDGLLRDLGLAVAVR
jgi:hypothetical protein